MKPKTLTPESIIKKRDKLLKKMNGVVTELKELEDKCPHDHVDTYFLGGSEYGQTCKDCGKNVY